jgi:HAD superfamily hydrolase (TIGR01549 family)
MGYKAILFDLEGTLVDFQWKMDKAVEEATKALSVFGFDTAVFSGNDYAALFNKAMEESQRLGFSVEGVREKIEEIYDRFDMDALSRWTPKDDTAYILENLINRGILTGLVTNAGQKAVSLLLRRFDFDGMLKTIITRNSVKRLKPEGEGLQSALDVLKVGKGETLFVGDSITDILASREVGVDIAVIPGGESSRHAMKLYVPDFILGALSEILRIL